MGEPAAAFYSSSPQAMTRSGWMRISSWGSVTVSARPRISMPRGRQGSVLARSSMTTAAWAARATSRYWIGYTIRIGDQVRLSITSPCPRCVMTTLAQADLPKDSGILRAAA
jgi:hypothetical protein